MIVIEDLRGLKKADAMLLLVLAGLLRIPLKYQHRASDSNLTLLVDNLVATYALVCKPHVVTATLLP